MNILLTSIDDSNFKAPSYGLWCLKAHLDCSTEFRGQVDIRPILDEGEASPFDVMVDHDVFGIQLCIWSESQLLDLAHRLRTSNPELVILAGGPQVTPQNPALMRAIENGVIDLAISGRAEQALLEVLVNIEGKPDRRSSANEFGPIYSHSIAEEEISSPITTSPEFLEASIDSGRLQLLTSDGCAFQCTYCNMAGNYRAHSLEHIFQDIAYIREHVDAKKMQVDLLDGTFVLNRQRALAILAELQTLGDDWAFHAEINIERLDAQLIEAMALAGFRSIEIGLQSSNVQTLSRIKRGFFREDRFRQNVRLAEEFGIETKVNLIIGLPGESLSDWLTSVDFCGSLGSLAIVSSTLRIFPSTALFNQVEQFGFDVDPRDGRIHASSTMPAEQVERAQCYNMVLDLLWNPVATRKQIRGLVEESFEGSLAAFLCAALQRTVELRETVEPRELPGRFLDDLSKAIVPNEQEWHKCSQIP